MGGTKEGEEELIFKGEGEREWILNQFVRKNGL